MHFIALDETGKDTGLKLEIEDVHGPHSRQDLYCGNSHIWIYNSKGEVLLQKRSATIRNYPNRWDISAAGHIDYGETPIHATMRELKEEVGLSVAENQLEFLKVRKDAVLIKPGDWRHNEFVWIYLFKVDKPTKDFILQTDEVHSVKWLSLEQFDKEIHDKVLAETYVPHGEYYDFIIKEIKKRTGKGKNEL